MDQEDQATNARTKLEARHVRKTRKSVRRARNSKSNVKRLARNAKNKHPNDEPRKCIL